MTASGPSGHDPMADHPTPVDTAHAMTTATRYEQHEERARGRFGRDVRPTAALDDVPMADARTTMQTDHAGERFATPAYTVDPDAVADAILSRLLAGRTLVPPRADDR